MASKEVKPKKTGKKQGNPDTYFKPGQSGNPNGRPRGTLNFHTHFIEAIKRIKDKNTGESITEVDVVYKYLQQALGGDRVLLDKLIDRLYGKALEKYDINADLTVNDPEKKQEIESAIDFVFKKK